MLHVIELDRVDFDESRSFIIRSGFPVRPDALPPIPAHHPHLVLGIQRQSILACCFTPKLPSPNPSHPHHPCPPYSGATQALHRK